MERPNLERKTPAAEETTGAKKSGISANIPETDGSKKAVESQENKSVADPTQVRAFLELIDHDGAVHLARSGKWTPKTFTNLGEAATAACNANDQGDCVYFVLNEPKGGKFKAKTKKGEKVRGEENIAFGRGVVIDIDGCGRDPDIIDDLEHRLDHRPTYIAFTGGGLQAGWLFEEPTTDIAATKAANKWLVSQFADHKPDSCFSVDHLWHLPGTRNKKTARDNRLCEIVGGDPKSRVPFEELGRAEVVEKPQKGDATVEVKKTDIKKPTDESLSPFLGADMLHVAKTSEHPKDKKKYKQRDGSINRSGAQCAVSLKAVSAGMPDDEHVGLLLAPNYPGASANILENANPYDEAVRQIKKAKEKATDDPVAFVNARYFAIIEGGKVRFYREDDDGNLEGMQKDAFRFELKPYKQIFTVAGPNGEKKIEAPYFDLWESSHHRRYYNRGFILDSKRSDVTGCYNLWRGFAISALAGNWELMKQHIKDVLASRDSKIAEYIIKFLAWTVQNPSEPARVALVFIGDEGVGKGIVLNAMREIFGDHGLRIQHMEHLTGRFNAHLRHCCLLFADEAQVVDPKQVGALKGYITEPTVMVELKGVDSVQADNHLTVVMASNNEFAVPADIGARRFAVFRVSDHRKGDTQYFKNLMTDANASKEQYHAMLGAMLHDLLAMDLGDFHPERDRPDTTELSRQKEQQLQRHNPIGGMFLDCLKTGVLPRGESTEGEGNNVTTNGAAGGPNQSAKDVSVTVGSKIFGSFVRSRGHDVSDAAVRKFFKSLGFTATDNNHRPRGSILPPLVKAREAWDTHMFKVDWDELGDLGDKPEWYIESDERLERYL